MEGEDAADIQEMEQKLEREREELQSLINALIKKERESNDELQAAHKELLTVCLLRIKCTHTSRF